MKLGGLGDCHCESGETDIKVPLSRSAPLVIETHAAPAKKPRKPRSKGKGSHCVVSHKGKVVHCYEDKGTADRVAQAFTKKGRASTKFHVQDRKG